MRRVAVYVMLGVGTFLLVLAPLLRFYAYPNLAKAPLDQDSVTVSEAPDATFLDIGALQLREGETLTATRTVRGDVAAGSDDTAVYDVFVKVVDEDDQLVTASTDRVAFDRRTSEAVDCCGASLNGTPTKHEGIEYKFPFNAAKKTYQYFDTTLGRATPMEYTGSEKLEGLNVYRYEQPIEPTEIQQLDVPGSLIGRSEGSVPVQRFYSNTRRVWVEPRTGVIVKGQEEQFSTLRDDTGEDVLTVTQATLTFTDETVKDQAQTAKDASGTLGLIQTTLPLVLGLVGLLLVLFGAGLLAREGRDGDTGSGMTRRRRPAPVGA